RVNIKVLRVVASKGRLRVNIKGLRVAAGKFTIKARVAAGKVRRRVNITVLRVAASKVRHRANTQGRCRFIILLRSMVTARCFAPIAGNPCTTATRVCRHTASVRRGSTTMLTTVIRGMAVDTTRTTTATAIVVLRIAVTTVVRTVTAADIPAVGHRDIRARRAAQHRRWSSRRLPAAKARTNRTSSKSS
ncbi:MAG TPA: hypothetical protein VGX76_22980, partial [Pirellulales bacterium]|nr:hypothetical protein [Pirellulales bacterium]